MNETKSDFFNHISTMSNQLTKTGRKIYQYIKTNPENILYLSITDLSTKIGVSETSIFRFCKTVGFEGYQEFKVSLARSLSIENNINDINETKQVTKEDSHEAIAAKLLSSNITSLNQTLETLSYPMLEKAVEYISRAQTIGFYGLGSSNITALEAKRKFGRIRKNVTHTIDLHDQIIMASLMDERDFAIVFSYSGATKDMLDIMRILKEKNVPILLITRFSVSAATELADTILICGSVDRLFAGDATSSKITQLFVVDILYTAYYISNYDEAKGNQANSLDAISPRVY